MVGLLLPLAMKLALVILYHFKNKKNYGDTIEGSSNER
jgi:hypothetical protein